MATLHMSTGRAATSLSQKSAGVIITTLAGAIPLTRTRTPTTLQAKCLNTTSQRQTSPISILRSIDHETNTNSRLNREQRWQQQQHQHQQPQKLRQKSSGRGAIDAQAYSQSRTFTTTAFSARREPPRSEQQQDQQTTPKPGSIPQPDPNLQTAILPSKIYSFEDIQNLISSSSSSSSNTAKPKTILIDVREPSEILGTGRIPGSKNVPISSAPDSFFLNAEDFEDRFGFEKPSSSDEVVFYCKAGVRSKAAARLAGQQAGGFGGKIGEFPGSWVEWSEKGGKIERD